MRMESVNVEVAPEEAAWKAFWRNAYSCEEPSTVPYPRVPLYELLRATARRFPDRTACTLYGRSMTFAELDDQSRRLATALIARGVGPGQHVGLLLPNIP